MNFETDYINPYCRTVKDDNYQYYSTIKCKRNLSSVPMNERTEEVYIYINILVLINSIL